MGKDVVLVDGVEAVGDVAPDRHRPVGEEEGSSIGDFVADPNAVAPAAAADLAQQAIGTHGLPGHVGRRCGIYRAGISRREGALEGRVHRLDGQGERVDAERVGQRTRVDEAALGGPPARHEHAVHPVGAEGVAGQGRD